MMHMHKPPPKRPSTASSSVGRARDVHADNERKARKALPKLYEPVAAAAPDHHRPHEHADLGLSKPHQPYIVSLSALRFAAG